MRNFFMLTETGPVNIRKGPYNLKDGDWIGVRDDDEPGSDKDGSKEDKNVK